MDEFGCTSDNADVVIQGIPESWYQSHLHLQLCCIITIL